MARVIDTEKFNLSMENANCAVEALVSMAVLNRSWEDLEELSTVKWLCNCFVSLSKEDFSQQ